MLRLTQFTSSVGGADEQQHTNQRYEAVNVVEEYGGAESSYHKKYCSLTHAHSKAP